MDYQTLMTARAVYRKITEARRPIIVAHRKPDGDTIGSLLAIHNLLCDLEREPVAFCVDRPPAAYDYLPRASEITTDPAVFRDEAVDLICVLDSGDLKYAGVEEIIAALPRRPFLIVIDHHVTNQRYGDLNLIVPGASSTAEVVSDFFEANDIEPDRRLAACLMTGILTDTSNFSNPGTTVESLRAASDLTLKGASIRDLNDRLFRNRPIRSLRIWGKAMERLRLDPATGVATTALFQQDFLEDSVSEEDLEGLSNFLNRFLDAGVVLVLRELPGGKVKGSYRSACDVDVAELAVKMGGGGHRKAAGFTAPGRIVEDTVGWRVG